ncbi:MAG: HAD family phosphatase [Planctomycetia bacterium]|nr:HAD family phosphatase [Planctomycetia bacterium]
MVNLSDFGREKPFSGVIFDFNGTLFWDTAEHDKSWGLCMQKYGVTVTPEMMFKQFHGKPNDLIIRELLGKETPETVIQEIITEKERIYQEVCLQRTMQLAPGAEELLDFLKENSVPFTVATSAPAENIEFYFQHLNIGRWFQWEKIVYFDGKTPGKPNPEFYQRAMWMIACSAEETVIFEDAPSGILAAENAGCRNIVRVDSENVKNSPFSYPVIRDFGEVNREIFTK